MNKNIYVDLYEIEVYEEDEDLENRDLIARVDIDHKYVDLFDKLKEAEIERLKEKYEIDEVVEL